MRLLVALGLLASSLLGFAPGAGATAAGACTISGTISFWPDPLPVKQGTWSIEPAVIECRGLFNGWERMLGPGSFSGSGSYSAPPSDGGNLLHYVGSGTVDYWIPTSEQDVHITEPHRFVLVGGGAFTTPALRGTFQVLPPYDGDGVRQPLTKAVFVAEAVLTRFRTPPL